MNALPMESLSQNPFALLTLIVAPAILTNASSVLALSTSNRFLRSSERMRELSATLEKECSSDGLRALLIRQVTRVEKQAVLLLSALRGIYVSLGAFSCASLVSVVGAGLAGTGFLWLVHFFVGFALLVGFTGAGGLVWGCVHLFRATQFSMVNMSEEAEFIREREDGRARS